MDTEALKTIDDSQPHFVVSPSGMAVVANTTVFVEIHDPFIP